MEVAEAISLALQNFHFGVKAFGDSVIAGEAPHASDLVAPGMESIAEGDQRREPATTKRRDVAEEAAGQILPGTPFPSVRALSKELKINPNTAHKVIAQLVAEGLLEVRVGVGTVVAQAGPSTALERSRLLKEELEELVVEAKKLGMALDEILHAVEQHWRRLGGNKLAPK